MLIYEYLVTLIERTYEQAVSEGYDPKGKSHIQVAIDLHSYEPDLYHENFDRVKLAVYSNIILCSEEDF